ncbi:glycerate kinase [Paraoerskovia marina]|uniref:Glycerate kinase n=1 Tax=Paraoerskovia marina TaxID=545619 RepID=A0A1H1QN46_9CELL|nr:glycerate kinase [Paraoerskovia marina]SDS24900.1 glycerate kinase [Paraoerskovia marina]
MDFAFSRRSATSRTLRVLVAPDAFKGTLAADEAARAMAEGVLAAAPDAEVLTLPMADGGEGTLRAFVVASTADPSADAVELVPVETVDALGRPCTARWGRAGRVAVVELAEASGLPGVTDRPFDPVHASTEGTGVLVRAALDAGSREILLGLGGSASVDGGAGVLRALGVRIIDRRGAEVPPGGAGLLRASELDLDALDARASAARWRLAVDVTNPLAGPQGAARVFGPQKGATPQDVVLLDEALGRWADVLEGATGVRVHDLAGAGAAGGVPAGLVAVLGAEIEPGAELVADALGIPGAMELADLVLTGEGRIDESSLQGKVVGTLAALASRTADPPPVVVLTGRVGLPLTDAVAGGVTHVVELEPSHGSTVDELRARTPGLLREQSEVLVREILRRP